MIARNATAPNLRDDLPSAPSWIQDLGPRSAWSRAGSRWLYLFIATDVFCQLGLFLFGGISEVRLPLRISVYALSLLLLWLTTGVKGRPYPPRRAVTFIIVLLAIQQLHPDGDRPFAQFAQLALYLSVLAPIAWGSRLRLPDPLAATRRVVIVLWLFYTASAVLGVLQVKYPGQFEGALSANYTKETILPHLFQLADGTVIIRPRGLTDNPGGAAIGGVFSIIFGIGIFVQERRIWLRGAALGGMVAGLFCIYICQGRTNLILIAIDVAVMVFMLFKRGLVARANSLLVAIVSVAAIGTVAAFAVGGDSTINRFNTLLAEDAGTVIYKNRGKFLDSMVTEDAMQYPLGAGMGRWGMMNNYFGDQSRSLWAEMTWQALLYDGGVPLIFAYAVLLFGVARAGWVAATRSRGTEIGIWGGVVCGANLSAIAASFVFPIFSMSIGLEILLLNACLYACYNHEVRQTPRRIVSSLDPRVRRGMDLAAS